MWGVIIFSNPKIRLEKSIKRGWNGGRDSGSQRGKGKYAENVRICCCVCEEYFFYSIFYTHSFVAIKLTTVLILTNNINPIHPQHNSGYHLEVIKNSVWPLDPNFAGPSKDEICEIPYDKRPPTSQPFVTRQTLPPVIKNGALTSNIRDWAPGTEGRFRAIVALSGGQHYVVYRGMKNDTTECLKDGILSIRYVPFKFPTAVHV